jgi:hypothetical protein
MTASWVRWVRANAAVAKTYVYIDGFNLYYGALKRTPYKWLDLEKLCQALLPADSIDVIKYFTARVSARPQNRSAPIDQQVYFRALRTIPNLEIVLGHFLTYSVRMTLTGTNPPKRVWVDKTEEKGSDVNLAAHLVRDAFKQRFELAVLITNDSDLAEPVRIVTKEVGMPVGILNPHEHHSIRLKGLATFVKRIRQSHLITSQFPQTMTDEKANFSKPTPW